MANTWDTLDPDTKRRLAMEAMSGQQRTNENFNRMMQQLAQNPRMVDDMLKRSGVGGEDFETQDQEEEPSMDDNIDDAMAQSASSDVQATGKVASAIPPAEQGESIDDYIMRLAKLQGK